MMVFIIVFTAVFMSLVEPGFGYLYYEVQEDQPVGYSFGNITVLYDDPKGILTVSMDSVGNELFDIIDASGKITVSGHPPLTRFFRLKKTLDREKTERYEFVLTIRDNYLPINKETSANVIIRVLDVNDNKPIFQGTPYTASIKENTPSDLVFQATATDADAGLAKSILYSFPDDCKITDCRPFIIDSTSGKVSLSTSLTLDYETKNRYNLEIFAKDRGTPSLSSSTFLIVTVTDENDRIVAFENSSYRVDIKENIPVGSSIVQTKAINGDRAINDPFKYAIIGGDDSNVFKINENTGLIYTNLILDSEAGHDDFKLIIKATEIPANISCTTTVFITIEDVNDNKPTFPATYHNTGFPYAATLSEYLPVGSTIFFQMGAFDNDKKAKYARFEYSIVGDLGNYFKIDPNNGSIELNRTIDFETEQQYIFDVVARETHTDEKLSSSQTITLTITMVQPQFNRSQYNFTVAESAKLGKVLGQVTTTNGDRGVTYSISGDGAEKFSVFHGTVSIASSLDFESRQNYSLKLEAKKDGTKVSRVPAHILITDENDNAPEFEPFPAFVNLDEHKQVFFSVTIKASDKDSGNNSVIKYFIVGGDPLNNFTINSVSGEIKTTVPLSFKTSKTFPLVIMAKDQGLSSQNSTEILLIKVNMFVLAVHQKVILTFGINDTDYVREGIDEFKKLLDDGTCLIFKIDSIQHHLVGSGVYDLSRVDVVMYALEPKTRDIVNASTVFMLLDSNQFRLADTFKKFKVEGFELEKPAKLISEDNKDIVSGAAAICLAAFVLILLPLLFLVLFHIKKSDDRKLRAVRAIAMGSASYDAILRLQSQDESFREISPSGTFNERTRDSSWWRRI